MGALRRLRLGLIISDSALNQYAGDFNCSVSAFESLDSKFARTRELLAAVCGSPLAQLPPKPVARPASDVTLCRAGESTFLSN